MSQFKQAAFSQDAFLKAISAGSTSMPKLMSSLFLEPQSLEDSRRKQVLQLVREKGYIDVPIVMQRISVDAKTASELLMRMSKEGLLIRN
jgi:hypothetical protein